MTMSEPSGTINTELLNDLVTQILTATQQGLTLDIHDPDQVGQFVFAVLGLGAGLIPVVGPALGALCNLLGAIFFTSNQTEDIWNALRERIENLIDTRIAAHELEVLQSKVTGFQRNWEFYTRSLKDLDEASPDQKPQAADTVKTVHIAFRIVLQSGIPEFQMDAYAVAALPLFSIVATMYLGLLADGVKRGSSWGYSDTNIASMRAEFVSLTRSSTSIAGLAVSRADMKQAIDMATDIGASHDLLETWKHAHARVFEHRSIGDPQTDWPTYVNNIYTRGRGNVQTPDGDGYAGYPEARQARVFSQYDTNMILNCLNYATLWPFMLGDPWTADAIKLFDRPIFYGPYSRWADDVPWTSSNPPPDPPRDGPISAINIRAWDDVDGLQIQYGGQWGPFMGNSNGGASRVMSLAADEYVTTVRVNSGFKLGSLSFTTNKGNNLSNGAARHTYQSVEPQPVTIAPPGYGLTYVGITRWVYATPTGCEGVILGFRPLLTNPQLAS